MPHDTDDHDLGFAHDLPRLIGRRGMLGLLGGVGLTMVTQPAVAADCVAVPWETAGPFPADGTNRRSGEVVNALTQAGVIREDIRPSFNGLTPTADGVPVTLDITLSDAASCGALSGHAIYLWHCDAAGRYSMYDLPDANFLRGVGVSDAQGRVRVQTILPGCYPGRWPHIHFEVFESAEAAVTGRATILTSQIALPEDICAAVYEEDPRYAASTRSFPRISLTRDGIFRNNSEAEIAQQTPVMEGTVRDGYRGAMTIPLAL